MIIKNSSDSCALSIEKQQSEMHNYVIMARTRFSFPRIFSSFFTCFSSFCFYIRISGVCVEHGRARDRVGVDLVPVAPGDHAAQDLNKNMKLNILFSEKDGKFVVANKNDTNGHNIKHICMG